MSLFPQPITIVRATRVLNGSTGKWERTETQTTLTGSNGGTIQPATTQNAGQYFASMEPGRKNTGTIVIYTRSNLRVDLEGSTDASDLVIWQNTKWEIVQKEARMGIMLPHTKYYAEYRGPA